MHSFCGACGAPWQPHWLTCAACQPKRVAAPCALQIEAPDHSIQQSLILYFCLLALCGVNIVAGSIVRDGFNIGLAVEALMSVLVLIWAAAKWRSNLAGLLRVPRVEWFALALALSVATFSISHWVIHDALHLRDTKVAWPFIRHGWGWGMVILAFAVQPAVIEELAFRGIMLGSMRQILGNFQVVIVTALMFMILHLSPVRFPHTLALGLAAGFLRVRSKSLLPCFVLHFSHNFICLAMEWMR
jgi:membrane protease YdiL (CAAX protease family)